MSDSAEEATIGAPLRVLIVDNDEALAQAMREALNREGYHCAIATSGPEGARRIEHESHDLIVTDMVMNEVDGMAILAQAKKLLPESEVVMVTGHASVPVAVEAMQQGAFNFLEKPVTPKRLRAVVGKAADAVRLRKSNQELHQRLDERFGFEGIIFASSKMKQVLERVKRIAPTDASVFIAGESGTGKELIAQAIHQNSPRKAKTLYPLNARAVSEQLVESELFGHVKGAFTDARTDRMGAFEYANGGTIFFDEVADMPMSTQIKLLRVLETHEIKRLGDNKSIPVNVRVLSATNRSLEDLVTSGEFREDLYFRMKVVTVELPPLRERREDIVPLVDHFRKGFNKELNKNVGMPTAEVLQRFFVFDWPGNIRQLRNVIYNMAIMDIDGVLGIDDLPVELGGETSQPTETGGSSHLLGRPLAEIERWAIEETLRLTNNNREEAAKMLGIGNRTIYRKLNDYKAKNQESNEAGSPDGDATNSDATNSDATNSDAANSDAATEG